MQPKENSNLFPRRQAQGAKAPKGLVSYRSTTIKIQQKQNWIINVSGNV